MKNKILIVIYCMILISCGGNPEEKPMSENNATETNTTPEPAAPADADSNISDSRLSDQTNPVPDNNPFIEGKNLIQESNCLSCHKEQEKVVGPAYVDIAKKYKATDANIKLLSSRIINGSTGIWGTDQMIAHPDLTEEDANKMVQYILSLDKK